MTDRFVDQLTAAAERNHSLLCVGLDPDPSLMPLNDVFEFNRAIIDATSDLVCAYKPNVAFYDGLGEEGHKALSRTLEHIPADIPVIGDSKRGDVQPTTRFHAKAMFEQWRFDAATINAYGGRDSVQPFLDYQEKGIFIWCRSTNPGAEEIQDLLVKPPDGSEALPLYQWIAMLSQRWNDGNNVGLVVGATYPQELRRVRELCPHMPILIPGIGAQLGKLEDSVAFGTDSVGRNAIFNVSRSVLYASQDRNDFDKAANREARALRDRINMDLEVQGKSWSHVATTAT